MRMLDEMYNVRVWLFLHMELHSFRYDFDMKGIVGGGGDLINMWSYSFGICPFQKKTINILARGVLSIYCKIQITSPLQSRQEGFD